MEYANAQLQYYLHIADPDSLSDEMWALKIKQLAHIRQAEKNQ